MGHAQTTDVHIIFSGNECTRTMSIKTLNYMCVYHVIVLYLFHSSKLQILHDNHQQMLVCSHHNPFLEQRHKRVYQRYNIHSTNHHVWNHKLEVDQFGTRGWQLGFPMHILSHFCNILHQLYKDVNH